ncbi:MAG TPA: hypothetical protein VG167_17665 [Verrucomicrobiae bacterium]|nr:hypothetical protein [Verrucomicrobiae bacterium]
MFKRFHGTAAATALLVVFGGVVTLTQLFDNDPAFYGIPSVLQFAERAHRLAQITNMVEFDLAEVPFDGACRRLALALPPDARIYMDDMVGPTNSERGLLYAAVTYYLFPREVATSLDQPALITREGFLGHPAEYRDQLVTNGFDVELNAESDTIKGRPLRPLALQPVVTPAWFHSAQDTLLAGLLPLLTAFTGLWLLGWLFPGLYGRLTLPEKLACGLGLGMLALAALTLGVKLAGFTGQGLPLLVTGTGAICICWKHRHNSARPVWESLRQLPRTPAALLVLVFFMFVFSAAGIFGLLESDAVCGWMLKAKILHLYTGHDIVHWFSQPRLAHGHMDYPTLVPSLHAATFDSLGHVDEYVTKFWPGWMLLLLVGALASLNRRASGLPQGASFGLLLLVLLPATRQYVESEGSTLPMIFFTTLGLVECALGQTEQDKSRVGLGLVLLFGAAMTKFEGALTLGATLFWLAAFGASRRLLRPSKAVWPALTFCLLTAVPFVCLRLQIPALQYESWWAGDIMRAPMETLVRVPAFLLMISARWFLNPNFAYWQADGDWVRWCGHWEGFRSLYDPATLGLPWLAAALSCVLWFIAPARRKVLVWLGAVLLTLLFAFGTVFSGFATTMDPSRALGYYTGEIASGRYLFPVLLAWTAMVVTLIYREAPQPFRSPGELAPQTATKPASKTTADRPVST